MHSGAVLGEQLPAAAGEAGPGRTVQHVDRPSVARRPRILPASPTARSPSPSPLKTLPPNGLARRLPKPAPASAAPATPGLALTRSWSRPTSLLALSSTTLMAPASLTLPTSSPGAPPPAPQGWGRRRRRRTHRQRRPEPVARLGLTAGPRPLDQDLAGRGTGTGREVEDSDRPGVGLPADVLARAPTAMSAPLAPRSPCITAAPN
jgi:hypothetical protein